MRGTAAAAEGSAGIGDAGASHIEHRVCEDKNCQGDAGESGEQRVGQKRNATLMGKISAFKSRMRPQARARLPAKAVASAGNKIATEP
jgi:hypothetical protein